MEGQLAYVRNTINRDLTAARRASLGEDQKQKIIRMAAARAVGAGVLWILKPKKRFGYRRIGTPTSLGIGAAAGSLVAIAAKSLSKMPKKITTLEEHWLGFECQRVKACAE